MATSRLGDGGKKERKKMTPSLSESVQNAGANLEDCGHKRVKFARGLKEEKDFD